MVIERMCILALLGTCLISSVTSHLCLIEPHQRGSMENINKPGVAYIVTISNLGPLCCVPGAEDCLLTTSPCGGRWTDGNPGLAYKGGNNITIIFQKNLDHYNSTTPGFFTVAIGNSFPGLRQVAMVADKGEPSLTLYSATVPIPPNPDPFQIIQVMYVTKNPKAPPVFYQCASFAII